VTAEARFPFFTPTHRDMLSTEHRAAVVDDDDFGIAWHTTQSVAELFWGRAGDLSQFSGERVRPFQVVADGDFHTYRVDLFRSPGYTGAIDGLRLDPVADGEPGAWVDIACISWKPCPVNRSRTSAAHSTSMWRRPRSRFLDRTTCRQASTRGAGWPETSTRRSNTA
jgi:hypothetical protein